MCLSFICNYRPLNNWSGQGSRLSDFCPWWPSNLAMDMLWLNVGETSTPTANLVSIHPYPCYTSAFCLRHCAPTHEECERRFHSLLRKRPWGGCLEAPISLLSQKAERGNCCCPIFDVDLKLHSDLESEHDSDASSYKC